MSFLNNDPPRCHQALIDDVATLESIVQLAMNNTGQFVIYFSRLAAIARYGNRIECPEIDRTVLLAAIQELCKQYEQEVRTQEDLLRSAYALRELGRGNGSQRTVN